MIDYEFYADSNVTACVLWVSDGENVNEYVGTARRDPRDKNNPDIGQGLALARALEKAARSISRFANGKVKQADWVEQQRLQRLMRDPDGSLARHKKAQYILPDEDFEVLPGSTSRNDMWLEDGSLSLSELADQRAMAHEEDNNHGDR